MKRLIPGRIELAIFAALAVLCAGVILLGTSAQQRDLWAAVFCIPLFIVAAVMGLRRSPAWAVVPETIEPRSREDAK